MGYKEFLQTVMARGQFETEADAEKAMQVVFSALAERLTGAQLEQLSGFLPIELRRYLQQGKLPSEVSDDLLGILRRKEGMDATVAGYHARAVLSGVIATLPAGDLPEILSMLPGDVRELCMVESWVKEERC